MANSVDDLLARATAEQRAVARNRLVEPEEPRRGGGLLSVLPSVLAAGASFIPGVGTAAAAGLGGAGELLRQRLSGEDMDLGAAGREAALSAVPGGVGLAVKGVRAARAAKTGATVAKASKPSLASRLGKRMEGRARGIFPGAKTQGLEQLDVKDADELNTFLSSEGIRGRSAERQLEELGKLQERRGAEIGGIVEKANRPLTTAELGSLKGRAQNQLGGIVGLSRSEGTPSLLSADGGVLSRSAGVVDDPYARNLARDLENVTDLKSANEMRKRLDADAINYGRNSNAPDPMKEQIARAYRRALDEEVAAAIPDLKGVQRLYGQGESAREFLMDAARNPKGINIFGNNVGGETIQGGKALMGEATSGLSELMQRIAPFTRFTGALAAQGATRAGAAALTPDQEEQQATQDTPLGDGGLDDSITGLDGVDSGSSVALQDLFDQAMAAPDAKTQRELLDLAEKAINIQGKLNPTGTARKPLSAEASRQVANAKSGLRALEQIESEIAGGVSPTTNRFASLAGNLGRGVAGTQGYEAARQELVDIIARLRTGAAITAKEEQRFSLLLPQAFDEPDTIKQKINRYRELLSDVLNRQAEGSPDLELAGVKGT